MRNATDRSLRWSGPALLGLALATGCAFDSSGQGSAGSSASGTDAGTDAGSSGGDSDGGSDSITSTSGGSASGSATSTSSTSGASASTTNTSTSTSTSTSWSTSSSTSSSTDPTNTATVSSTTGNPPSPYYGDCVVDEDCEFPEYCLNIAGSGDGETVCGQPCFGTLDCPDAPAGTNAGPECVPLSGGQGNVCVLACDGGTPCPAGMMCEMLMVGDICFWP